MEVNRDEAERALSIAQQKWAAGDQAGALRLARRSHALYPTDASTRLVGQYAAAGAQGEGLRSRGQAKAKAAAAAAAKEPGPEPEPEQQRTYTQEQVQAVRAVMEVKDDYYRVLGIGRTASEAEIKKAYRKSALAFHPDKNTAPGADEAFKLVAHAFTVLSDGDKRAHYDRFGAAGPSHAHPRQHQHQYQQHPFAGAFGGGRFHAMDDEISPEDLFNMFFGGNFGQFNVQFGPNGGAFAQQRGARFARGQQPGAQAAAAAAEGHRGLWAACLQLLPLVLLVLSFFASSLGTLLFGDDAPPSFAFERTAQYGTARTTRARNVDYWVNSSEFARSAVGDTPARLRRFERDVEAHYVSHLQRLCRQQREHKRNQIYLAQGWFGLGVDRARLEAAEAIPLPACDELRRFR
ncbi:Chaperone protein dnaJ [Coemansia javaensis]|uniref:Chaperone protein dnaJ n=1 Tax=Coemansia javaensis TaxID=2761396 RepID=A0A9W8LH94_9FUNG|nr:Chaperone protein dnaJ [Coemansia javaensis]